MKINTDGVLLAALANINLKNNVLDIGTGTGVIALMLAQLNLFAKIDALEIDSQANQTAALNFSKSPFANRLIAYNLSFEAYFKNNASKFYDLIISNPPFFIDALKSDNENKNLARHTNAVFFENLIHLAAQQLTINGVLQLIVPMQIETLIVQIALKNELNVNQKIVISSFTDSKPIRCILSFGKSKIAFNQTNFAIYESQGIHSVAYKTILKDFFMAF